jgi:hypothetical protein
MGSSTVRQQLLPLLLLTCLASVQLAAAAHPVAAIGRELLAARPYATPVEATRSQFVQVTLPGDGMHLL